MSIKIREKQVVPGISHRAVKRIAQFGFKEDVILETIPELAKSYATTVRRTVVDIAAKLTRSSGKIVLKVTQATMDNLNFPELWSRAQRMRQITA